MRAMLLLVLILAPSSAPAQAVTGSLQGRVLAGDVDPLQGVVATALGPNLLAGRM